MHGCCGKRNFRRRRRQFPLAFFYHVEVFCAEGCVRVVVRLFPDDDIVQNVVVAGGLDICSCTR